LIAAVAAIVASPAGGLVRERIASSHRGSGDLSIDVRAFELTAATRQVRMAPFLGIGSGGQFRSLYQSDPTHVAYGATNFVHSAYVYFPLKFGLLGFATVFALVGGVLAAFVAALKRAAARGLRELVFVCVLAVVLTASATAPNLVDPTYSLFCGLIACLAGLPAPVGNPGKGS
jgi:O-antigen ligase